MKLVLTASAMDTELTDAASLLHFRQRTQRQGQHPSSCHQALKNTNLLQPFHQPAGLSALIPFTCSSSLHFLVKAG